MCGRYALSLNPRQIRGQFRAFGLPVDNDDDELSDGNADSGSTSHREGSSGGRDAQGAEGAGEWYLKGKPQVRPSYNVAPGYFEPVYRAVRVNEGEGGADEVGEHTRARADEKRAGGGKVKYVLEPMKWGLIPSWAGPKTTDYTTLLKTINCRDDSLASNSGMWTSMKKKKRCVVPAEGYFEWMKKGKDKIPYFIHHKTRPLIYMAALWDRVRLETPPPHEPSSSPTQPPYLYTYSIITTSPSSTISHIHDRMPVLLATPEAILEWVDPETTTWTPQLQSLLRPWGAGTKGKGVPEEAREDMIEAYRVTKDVGRVGRSDKSFVMRVEEAGEGKAMARWLKGGPPSHVKKEKYTGNEDQHRKVKTEESTDKGEYWTAGQSNTPLPVGIGKEEKREQECKDEVHATGKRGRDTLSQSPFPAEDPHRKMSTMPSQQERTTPPPRESGSSSPRRTPGGAHKTTRKGHGGRGVAASEAAKGSKRTTCFFGARGT